MSENLLLMPFIDESEAFCNGFECGTIWAKVQDGEILIDYYIHDANIPQIDLIMSTYKCAYKIKPLRDGWSSLTMESSLNAL